MSDNKSKFEERLEELQRVAERKARELDEKYKFKEKLEEGARRAQDAVKEGSRKAQEAVKDGSRSVEDAVDSVQSAAEAGARTAQDALKTGAEKVAQGATAARDKAAQFDPRLSEAADRAKRAAEDAARRVKEFTPPESARDAAEKINDSARRAAANAGASASKAYGEARRYYDKTANVIGRGMSAKRATEYAFKSLRDAAAWATANPLQAGAVTLSLVFGTRLGAAFPALDAIFLGAHPHWFTHSALPIYGLRKAGAKFDEYLTRREQLINDGKLTDAERERVEFERKIVKYVGAPLLGAFSCAAGAAMWAQIFQPGNIAGAPISWLLGGNPVLEGIWLFGNGVICFQQGYKFFMIALKDKEEVTRLVREVRGLLASANQAA